MIIGLSGYGQSGKDTAAQFLVEDYGFKKVAWADALRQCLIILNPRVQYKEGGEYHDLADALVWYGYEKLKASSPQFRDLLQRMGTDVGRNVLGENVWVDATLRRIASEPKQEHWVIADTRFPNELEAIKKTGGKVIRISRPLTPPVNNHPSETALDSYSHAFSWLVVNDGSLQMFRDGIHAAMKYLL